MVEVVRQRGSAAELHSLDPFSLSGGPGQRSAPEPQVWWCDVNDASIILGSRQSLGMVDPVAAASAGLDVVRRRSGGGALIVRPEAIVWIDVVLPHGFAPGDVRASMVWVGERWSAAVAPFTTSAVDGDPIGPDRRLTVHRGGMVDTAWSRLVCFAGLGPGEVSLGGRKLVGLSQRRTRFGIRVQGLVYRAPVTSELARLFVGDLPPVDLVEPATLPMLDAEAVAVALAAELSSELHAG